MKSVLLVALLICVANAKVANLKSFSWSTECGTGNPIQVNSLSVTPDPILLPGDVTLSVSVVSTESIVDAPGTIVDILLQKEVNGAYVDLPCLESLSLGSCSYDLCPTLDTKFVDADCPATLADQGIPCHCSQMVAGEYNVDGLVMSFPMKLPASLTNGNYHAHVTLTSDHQLGCLDLYLTLEVVA